MLCPPSHRVFVFFFFNDTATTEIYTLSLHDALPISPPRCRTVEPGSESPDCARTATDSAPRTGRIEPSSDSSDRKSTRLNSSHSQISYAVFCLKKKKNGGNGRTRSPPLYRDMLDA